MIKEQDEFKLVQILNKYFPDILLETLSECANEIIQAGYAQLQADSEGLVEIINPCGICEYNCPQEKKETCVMYQYYTIKILALKAQKALCDAEKDEAVKKVFSGLRSKMWHSETPYCDREYRITVEDYETILSQMEEE